ncbi:HNH endonuclease [Mycobacterium sp. SWH-M1]|nr:HNH endonuclease [Mycobacterium sp. SWH-M1]
MRDAYKRSHPVCEVPGCRRPVHDVDHIKPLAEGGSRWDPANWQSLCAIHHAAKTSEDALRGKRRPR